MPQGTKAALTLPSQGEQAEKEGAQPKNLEKSSKRFHKTPQNF